MAGCAICGKPREVHSFDNVECGSFVEGGPDDIVGHKTFDTGERCPETGFPVMRHEPLTRAEGEAMWAHAEAAKADREKRMPDDRAAINALWDAHQRLKELGWREGCYSPRDGETVFKVIEPGSTGIFDCTCHGEWPDCTWTSFDDRDAYPSSQAPMLFKLSPEDQAKRDAKMAEAAARYRAEITS
jgi:hypothetical protein